MSPSGSDAVTVPVTAPVLATGVLTTTLDTTGGLFAADGLGTTCPVVTVAAGAVAVCSEPSSRRAAASITQDTGDCTGAPVPVPSSGASTDSTTPRAAARRGAAIIAEAAGGFTGGATATTDGI